METEPSPSPLGFLFLRRGGLWPPAAGSFPLLGRGGYHPPAFSSYEKGTWGFRLRASRDNFALRGDLLCPRRQSRQNAAGGGSRAFSMPYPAIPTPSVSLPSTSPPDRGRRPPGPPSIYVGATKGLCISIRRGQRTGYRSSRRPLRSRWRLCRFTDAAYPLRVLPLRVGRMGLYSYKSCRAWRSALAEGFFFRAHALPHIFLETIWFPPAWATGSPPGRPPGPGKPGHPAGQRAPHPGSAPPAAVG